MGCITAHVASDMRIHEREHTKRTVNAAVVRRIHDWRAFSVAVIVCRGIRGVDIRARGHQRGEQRPMPHGSGDVKSGHASGVDRSWICAARQKRSHLEPFAADEVSAHGQRCRAYAYTHHGQMPPFRSPHERRLAAAVRLVTRRAGVQERVRQRHVSLAGGDVERRRRVGPAHAGGVAPRSEDHRCAGQPPRGAAHVQRAASPSHIHAASERRQARIGGALRGVCPSVAAVLVPVGRVQRRPVRRQRLACSYMAAVGLSVVRWVSQEMARLGDRTPRAADRPTQTDRHAPPGAAA